MDTELLEQLSGFFRDGRPATSVLPNPQLMPSRLRLGRLVGFVFFHRIGHGLGSTGVNLGRKVMPGVMLVDNN